MDGLLSQGISLRFEKYQDAKGEWRWSLFSSNGRIIADSGEGYKNQADCDNGIRLVVGANSLTPVRLRAKGAFGL